MKKECLVTINKETRTLEKMAKIVGQIYLENAFKNKELRRLAKTCDNNCTKTIKDNVKWIEDLKKQILELKEEEKEASYE